MHRGNILIISSSSAVVISLTWGGVRYAWTSANVLAPLIIGLIGMISFVFYEAKVAKEPLVSPLKPTLQAKCLSYRRFPSLFFRIGRP